MNKEKFNSLFNDCLNSVISTFQESYEGEQHENVEFTITMNHPAGHESRGCIKRCRDIDGVWKWMKCEDCPRH